MNCDKKGCTESATKQVSLILKPTATSVPATTSPLVFVCDKHSDIQWNDVVGQDSWKQVLWQFKKQRLMLPVKKHCSIKVEPIKQATSNQN